MSETSRKYWIDREAANLRANLAKDAVYTSRLNYYQVLLENDINQQIESFYQRYAKAEGITLADAQRRVTTTDIRDYEAKAKRYVELANMDRENGTDNSAKYFSGQANAEMRLYNTMMKINRLEMLKAELGMTVDESYMQMRGTMADGLKRRTDEELTRQAGILGETVFHNAEDVDRIVNASFHNATWYERLVGESTQLKNTINTLLAQGLIQGYSVAELSRTLRKAFEVSRYEADRLMRTELARVQTDAQMESFRRNGYTQYEFIALETSCTDCRRLDGQIFDVDKEEIGYNSPPVHPNCRCSTAAYSSRDDFNQMMREEFGLEAFTSEGVRGIINIRGMANGPRRSVYTLITDAEEKQLRQEAKELGIPEAVLSFNTGTKTGFDEVSKRINIKGDVFPSDYAENPNSVLSSKAALAHEYYGHMLSDPSKFAPGDWRDEFRASYNAAVNAPNLSDSERGLLILDAYERAASSGVKVKLNKFAREMLYGI